MSLFGWREKKELEVYREVESRDKRIKYQVDDLKNKKNLEAFQAAVYFTAIVTLLFLLFGCNAKCDVPAESLEQRFSVNICKDTVCSVTVDTTYKKFNSICDCEDHCALIREAIQNSIQKDSTLKDYLSKYGQKCDCK